MEKKNREDKEGVENKSAIRRGKPWPLNPSADLQDPSPTQMASYPRKKGLTKAPLSSWDKTQRKWIREISRRRDEAVPVRSKKRQKISIRKEKALQEGKRTSKAMCGTCRGSRESKRFTNESIVQRTMERNNTD